MFVYKFCITIYYNFKGVIKKYVGKTGNFPKMNIHTITKIKLLLGFLFIILIYIGEHVNSHYSCFDSTKIQIQIQILHNLSWKGTLSSSNKSKNDLRIIRKINNSYFQLFKKMYSYNINNATKE